MRIPPLLCSGLLVGGIALSQGIPRPPTPIPSPPPPNVGGQAPLPIDPCRGATDLIRSLSVEPQTIYPGDQVTLRWDARDPRGFAWDGSVHLRSSFPISPAFPDPAPKSGSQHFHASESPVFGTITMETVQGLCRKTRTVQYERVHTPSIATVNPARASSGTEIVVRGADFGPQAGGALRFAAGGHTVDLTPTQWGAGTIRATIPNGAPAGAGTLRVVRGGRLESNAVAFRVVRSITFNNAAATAALASLAISNAFVHFTDGQGASAITLPTGMTGGVPFNFTLEPLDVEIPAGEKVAQSVLLPGTGFPMRIKYQVNDVNSNSVAASVAGGQIVFTIGFEEAGSEIKGRVRYCDVGSFGACLSASWKDGLAPDLQISNARATYRLTPELIAGDLAFGHGHFAFDADISLAPDFANWLVPSLRRWTAQLKDTMGDRMRQRLDTAGFNNACAGAVRARLRAVDPSFSTILSITPSGGSIVFEYE